MNITAVAMNMGTSPVRTVDDLLEQAWNVVPTAEERRRARRAIELQLNDLERTLITRLVLEEEDLYLVADSLKTTAENAMGILGKGLSKLCQNGRGVPGLCRLVEKGREIEKGWMPQQAAA